MCESESSTRLIFIPKCDTEAHWRFLKSEMISTASGVKEFLLPIDFTLTCHDWTSHGQFHHCGEHSCLKNCCVVDADTRLGLLGSDRWHEHASSKYLSNSLHRQDALKDGRLAMRMPVRMEQEVVLFPITLHWYKLGEGLEGEVLHG